MVMTIKFCEKKDWNEIKSSQGGFFIASKPSVWEGFATVSNNHQTLKILLIVEGRTITPPLELPEGLSLQDLQNLYDDFLKNSQPQTYKIEIEKENHDSASLLDVQIDSKDKEQEVDSQRTIVNLVLRNQYFKQHGFFSNPLNIMSAVGAVIGIVGALLLACGVAEMGIALMLSGFLGALAGCIFEKFVRSVQESPTLHLA